MSDLQARIAAELHTAMDVFVAADSRRQEALRAFHVANRAAGEDCNAGKSSSSPDADTVAQVSEDAARWAVARDIVLKQWHAERAELAEAKAQFLKAWKCWDSDAQYLPDNWESRVENWLLQGIALEQLFEALEIALANGWVSVSHIFRYMSGIVGRWLDEIDSRIEREVKGGNHGA